MKCKNKEILHIVSQTEAKKKICQPTFRKMIFRVDKMLHKILYVHAHKTYFFFTFLIWPICQRNRMMMAKGATVHIPSFDV
jgi:hypothetical protein